MAGLEVGSTTLAGSQVVAIFHEPLRGNRMDAQLTGYEGIEKAAVDSRASFRSRKSKPVTRDQRKGC